MSQHSSKKQKMLDRIAEENGVAVVVLDQNSREVSVSNNNSLCSALTASAEFWPRCAEYCGVAFKNTSKGEVFEYECYAGLSCTAVPVTDRGNRFVAIVGRAFTGADQYRQATDRAIDGDWTGFQPNEFFGNVLIAGSGSKIEKAASELSKFGPGATEGILDPETESDIKPERRVDAKPEATPEATPEAPSEHLTKLIEKFSGAPPLAETGPPVQSTPSNRTGEAAPLRAFYGKLAVLPYEDACASALEFVAAGVGVSSLVWLERKEKMLLPVAAIGGLLATPIKIGIRADNQRLVDASNQERPLELRERILDGEEREGRTLNLYTSAVGGEIRGAIGVEGRVDAKRSRDIALFCRRIGPQIEILRLRREISNREWLNRAVSRFNESLKRIDADDFWTHVTQVSAELVQSERASLLLHSEKTEGLVAKAAVGARIDLFTEPHIGERVSNLVLEDGHPVVVEDITRIGVRAAPSAWKYKTSSFLSYPILIG
ncbi:MAG: PocR ligand-binding domain-containing protein, partial [Acidobacteriota bacterium]